MSTFLFAFLGAVENPLPIGNFALPMWQQPSPLFSFGQNTVNKGDMIGYVNPVLLKGKHHKHYFYNEIYGLYGITDSASIFGLINVPASAKEDGRSNAGFGDTVFQGEYAFINKATLYDQIQATIVASIYLPSGLFEPSKQGPHLPPHSPFIGFGATSFFLGGTGSYTTFDWYTFASVGGFFIGRHKDTKLGNIVLYQGGVGRNLHHFKDKILMLLFEMDGICTRKDMLLGSLDQNSGYNVIFLGPVLYYAGKDFIFQVGIQAPIYQKFNGIQEKNSYFFR